MSIKIGDQLPASEFQKMTSDGPVTISSEDLFKGRNVVLVAVPGAFTPTCHNHHIPGFLENIDALLEKGIDEVAIVSVNDVHVMGHWARATDSTGKLIFLADGNGGFARAIGMDIDLAAGGMGTRSKRYCMQVNDGIVKQLNVEDSPGVADISSAAHLMTQL